MREISKVKHTPVFVGIPPSCIMTRELLRAVLEYFMYGSL